eukprot:TRINITY_DN3056_c0_g1_i1.p1 TRINITY_DN3056_c0_g1~~TRINITY_DN3056_c0_g1_i1.p1  ORF type:complete len:687 (-),score=267.22 TRINITY_DN3056_c0_g1_i1:360-2189(-)
MTFQQGLAEGDKKVIHPILLFVLPKYKDLKTRAYLAKFLAPMDIPEEYFQDEGILMTFEQFEELRREFTVVHKKLGKLQKNAHDPEETKGKIAELEDEKLQLSNRIANVRKQKKDAPNFEEMFAASSQLSKEQQRESEIANMLKQQKMVLLQTDQKLQRQTQRLKSVQTDRVGDGGPMALFARLAEETKRNSFLANDKLPQDIKEKKAKVETLQKIVGMPSVTESDLETLHRECLALKSEIKDLQDERDAHRNTKDETLSLLRQQRQTVILNKQQSANKLSHLQDEKLKLEHSVQMKQEKMQKYAGSDMPRGTDFERQIVQLKQKRDMWTKMSSELGQLNTENKILNNTIEHLKSKCDNVDEVLKKLEQKFGMVGYMDTQQKLEQLSNDKARAEQMTGEALEEYSRVVKDLNTQILDRKSKLAPQIKELRALREYYQQVDAEHEEKQTTYNNVRKGWDTEINTLQSELSQVATESAREESQFHFLQARNMELDVHADRLAQEAKSRVGDNRVSEHFKSYTELFESRVQELDSVGKALLIQKRELAQTYKENLKQKKQFEDLKLLLEKKIEVQKTSMDEMSSMTMMGAGDMMFGMGGGVRFSGNSESMTF